MSEYEVNAWEAARAEREAVLDAAWARGEAFREGLLRASATQSDTGETAGFGAMLTLVGGRKTLLADYDGGYADCWPDAETAGYGAKTALSGYGARDMGVENFEIVKLQRGQRMMTRAELRDLDFKKRAYKQIVALGIAKSALEDLTVDGCEYGDDCPAFSGSRHGVCRACRAKRVLDRIKVVEAT